MRYTFRDLAADVLKIAGRPLSSDEIWELALATGYDKKVGSSGKTPGQTVGARIYVDIRDNKDTVFITAGTNPRRFTLRELMTSKEAEDIIETSAPEGQQPVAYLEKDLHPLLAYYTNQLGIFTKTVNHSKSSKKEFGEWVHPDVVGCRFPFMDWDDKVYELARTINEVSISLFSFELKREINFANLREVFFQAVSNSSWANEGYLVAAVIRDDSDLRDELQRLSGSFGIGVILLNTKNPDACEVLFPAKPKEFIDWTMVRKVSEMNSDFKTFLERVRKDVETKEPRKEYYDKIYSTEELITKFQK